MRLLRPWPSGALAAAVLPLAVAAACSRAGSPVKAGTAAAVPATPSASAAPAPSAPAPADVPPAPAVATFDGRVTDAPPGVAASPGDTWKPVDAGDPIATVDLTLVRGLDGIEDQARTIQGMLAPAVPAGVDASALGPGAWLHGAMPVTKTESVPFAVLEDRSVLVLDADRDGVLEVAERLAPAETWGGLAWFPGDVLVRQVQSGKTLQSSVPVRIGVMLGQLRMASRIDGRRQGSFQAGGRTIRIAIVDHTFRGWFSHPAIDSLMVDADGDGAFDASPDSSERYRLGDPFPAGDADAVVTSVSPFAERITIARSKKPAVRKASLRIGAKAPTFEATTIDGKKVKLEGMKGKWVLLDFWATWCGPCRNELPHLLALRKNHPDLVILGISGDDTAEPVAAFVKAQGMDWSQIHAESRAVMRQYRVGSFPTSFLVAPDGTIAARDLRGPSISDQFGRLKAQFKKG